jgi:hypothetical protein
MQISVKSRAEVERGISVIVRGDKFFLNLNLISQAYMRKTFAVERFC